MSKNSYLGGSTVIGSASGWFSHDKPTDRRSKAVRSLQIEQNLFDLDAHRAEVRTAVLDAFRHDRPMVEFPLGDLMQAAALGVTLFGLNLRTVGGTELFSLETYRSDLVRFAARHHFSSWIFSDLVGRDVLMISHDDKPSKCHGFYKDEDEFCSRAAEHGWLITPDRDISSVGESRLREIWDAGNRPQQHTAWSDLN